AARALERSSRIRGLRADSLAVFWRERLNVDSLSSFADSLQKELRFQFRTELGPQLRALEEGVGAVGPDGAPHAFFMLGQRAVAGAELEEMNDGLARYFGTDHGVL